MMEKKVVAGAMLVCVAVSALAYAQAAFTKAQVADRIRKVEDGVDEFRKWAENRAEQGQSTAQAAKATGRTRGRTATESQKAVVNEKKDELDDALGI
jgi:TolA-binding protein